MSDQQISGDAVDELEKSLLGLDRVAIESILRGDNKDQTAMLKIENIVLPALERIGEGWEEGRVSLAQVYMSGRICEEMIDRILPPSHPDRKDQPKMAIVVLDDHHLLGKKIIYSALRASGYELLNYGQMDVETIVKKVKENGIKILLVSVLMLPSALKIKQLKEALNKESLNIKLLVGGAPFRFDKHLWQEVGADAMGSNPAEAVEMVGKLSEEIK
jgi:methanogenic corrinoid protein MtbC1